MRVALRHLSPRQREVMVLHAFGGLEMREVAQALRVRVHAARVALHHARRRLRVLLGEDSHESL